MSSSYIIARSSFEDVQWNAASGGVVSQFIIGHLKRGGVAIVPRYNASRVCYEMSEVLSVEDYESVGSIYHDLGAVSFVRSLVVRPEKRYVVVCLPCEAKAIRKHFTSAGAEISVIALACSGQLSYEATEELFSQMGIEKNDISSFRYRGGGWPGGVSIQLKNGNVRTCGNLDHPWYNIFNSNLYTLEKCFFCTDVLGKNADLTAADPWLPDEIAKEKVGRTLVVDNGHIKDIADVVVDEFIDEATAVYSQRYTFHRKLQQSTNRRWVKIFFRARPLLIRLSKNFGIVLPVVRFTYNKFWKLVK